MASATYQHGSKYRPSPMLEGMKKTLDFPRSYYSTNVSNLLSSNEGERKSYIFGLIVVGSLLFLIFFVWGGILVIFKLRGDEAGCAAGNAFKTTANTIDKDGVERQGSGAGSTDADDLSSIDSQSESPEEERSKPYHPDDSTTFSKHIKDAKRSKKRERRTRIVFFLVGTILLLCVPAMLILVMSPLQKAAKNSATIYLEVQGVINDLNTSIQDIVTTTISVESTVNSTPTDLLTICPYASDALNLSGVDVKQMVYDFVTEFHRLDAVMWNNISAAQDILEGSEKALYSFQTTLSAFKRYFWVIPGTLLFASILTTITMVATQLAWRKRSGSRLQRFMACLVTPLFIFYVTTCWLVTIAASLATMLSVDSCTAGPYPGTPDVTFQNMFSSKEGTPQSVSYQFVEYYTNGCTGTDPTAILVRLEGTIQKCIDSVWQSISDVDSVGDTYLSNLCGGDGLLNFLDGAQNVAKLLTNLRLAVESANINLQCSRINPIYDNAAYDVLCTEAATTAAWGLILFFFVSVASTILITLRASWYHKIEEEKVYQNEVDIAENMILDEHEEYLAYISRYKHEWQEYRGLESAPVYEWDDGDYEDGSLESSYLSGRSRGSDSSMRNEPRSDGDTSSSGGGSSRMDGRRKRRKVVVSGAENSVVTQDISFPSLKDPDSDSSSSDEEERKRYVMPPPLLPLPVDGNDLDPWETEGGDDAHGEARLFDFSDAPEIPVVRKDSNSAKAMHKAMDSLFFRDDDDDDDDDDESDGRISLGHSPLNWSSFQSAKRPATRPENCNNSNNENKCNDNNSTTTEANEKLAAGEGVEVALLSSIPTAIQIPFPSVGATARSNKMTVEGSRDTQTQHSVEQNRRPPDAKPVWREDASSVGSIYTSNSSINQSGSFHRLEQQQQQQQQQQQKPKLPSHIRLTPTPKAAAAAAAAAILRVRSSSPAFQSLVDKFEQAKRRQTIGG